MEKLYCTQCGSQQEIMHEKEHGVFDVLDTKIEAELTIARCRQCHEEVWDELIERSNDMILFNKYKEYHDLLTSDQVRNIREKYALSQSGFATLMGFGAKTITRYENGSIQDVAHDLLMRMMDTKKNFLSVWEQRKNHLKDKEVKQTELALCQMKEHYDTITINLDFSPSTQYYQSMPNEEVNNYWKNEGGTPCNVS
jgi:putative zinc finger/helix-turn-helix YgiT family protein